MSIVRAYIDGVEINKIPELADVCAKDDWMNGLLTWAAKNRPGGKMDAIFGTDTTSKADAPLLEFWIGGAPMHRATEIGGILKTFSHQIVER